MQPHSRLARHLVGNPLEHLGVKGHISAIAAARGRRSHRSIAGAIFDAGVVKCVEQRAAVAEQALNDLPRHAADDAPAAVAVAGPCKRSHETGGGHAAEKAIALDQGRDRALPRGCHGGDEARGPSADDEDIGLFDDGEAPLGFGHEIHDWAPMLTPGLLGRENRDSTRHGFAQRHQGARSNADLRALLVAGCKVRGICSWGPCGEPSGASPAEPTAAVGAPGLPALRA